MGGIGESLKSTREAKGISLEQAEEDTKIRKKYLQALEEGDYDVIPGRVYAKGFLRNYANYLGLNQEEVMLEYKLLGAPLKDEHKRVDIEASISKKRRLSGRSDRKTYLATVLIAVFALLVLVLYNFVYKNTNKNGSNPAAEGPGTEQSDKTKPADREPSNQQPAQPGENGNPSGNNTGAGTSGQTGTTGNNGQSVSGVNLTLNIKDGISWVRVIVDGNNKFEGNLNPGESRTYSGIDKISVRVGNAGAVEAIVNGQNMGIMGERGQPLTKEFAGTNPTD